MRWTPFLGVGQLVPYVPYVTEYPIPTANDRSLHLFFLGVPRLAHVSNDVDPPMGRMCRSLAAHLPVLFYLLGGLIIMANIMWLKKVSGLLPLAFSLPCLHVANPQPIRVNYLDTPGALQSTWKLPTTPCDSVQCVCHVGFFWAVASI